MDVFSPKKRSTIMSANRGSDNRSTERRLRAMLVASGIHGWRIDAKDIYGRPDFVFDQLKVTVFVDGCFWHGCSKCRNIPASNRSFWEQKITRNRVRDVAVTRRLKREGWRVIRFWEHDL
jgi:DNA mismatch endonuclease (patch repair protein)